MLNKIRNNCKKATFLIDKKNVEGINLVERIELYIHLASCSLCRLYDRQSRIINDLIGRVKQNDPDREERLSDDFKKTMADTISRQLKNI